MATNLLKSMFVSTSLWSRYPTIHLTCAAYQYTDSTARFLIDYHKATLKSAVLSHNTCWLQECPLEPFNGNFTTIIRLRCHFREFCREQPTDLTRADHMQGARSSETSWCNFWRNFWKTVRNKYFLPVKKSLGSFISARKKVGGKQKRCVFHFDDIWWQQ